MSTEFKVRLRASVVCVHEGRILVFNGIDPTSNKSYWFLPGGKIEVAEDPWSCCEREAKEETGYRLRALKETEIVKSYNHPWDGEVHACQTYFYKGILLEKWAEPMPVKDADYNKGAAWRPLNQLAEMFSYSPEIFDAVERLVK